MEREQAIDVLRQSRDLWSESHTHWFEKNSKKCVWAEQWIVALERVSYDAAIEAQRELAREVEPFGGRWQFVGQVIVAKVLARRGPMTTLMTDAEKLEMRLRVACVKRGIRDEARIQLLLQLERQLRAGQPLSAHDLARLGGRPA